MLYIHGAGFIAGDFAAATEKAKPALDEILQFITKYQSLKYF